MLQNEHEAKAKALRIKLFPKAAPADLSDVPDQPPEFPATLPFPDITEYEVSQAINSSRGVKAPGSDGIQNLVLKMAANHIVPLLTRVFNASLRLQYWPVTWKQATVVVIRKPAKKDYHDPKSYRPISLLKTLSKIMEFILTRRISAIAELHKLFAITHCGGRKATSTEYAIHLLLEQVHAGWRRNETSSLLLLDVSGAFENVNHQRLLWNIRELGYHENIVGWIASFLTGRTGRTRLSEGLMEPFNIESSIPQGSPLSPILWLLYKHKALTIANNKALITGFIDDTCILVTGKNTAQNYEQLEQIHQEMNQWASRHGAVFAPQKYELIHFIKKQTRLSEDERSRPIQITNSTRTITTLQPTSCARYLGVWLDSKLTGKQHMEKAIESATQQREALRGIAGNRASTLALWLLSMGAASSRL